MGWLSKRRDDADGKHEDAKAAVRASLPEMPHPAGAEVWESSTPFPDETDPDAHMLTSISIAPDRLNVVRVDADTMRMILVEAGYELRGIADGTAPAYDRQQDQQ